jgi:xanthine dehydrogenase accessory factor
MKVDLLRAAVEAQAHKTPVVVVRDLDASTQWLVDEHGAAEGLPEAVRTLCRAALRRDGTSIVESDGRRYLLQTLSPPYRLVVIGAVHIAQSLIPMARAAGYAPVLVDPRPAFASPERFPGVEIHCDWPQEVMPGLALDARSAVVTLSHDAKIDEPALAAALQSEAFYVGALGSRKNHTSRLERLAECGFDAATLARIAGPIGLPLGGRSPSEIAVAILAQIIQTRYSGAEVHA